MGDFEWETVVYNETNLYGGEAGERGDLELWPNTAKTIVNCQLSTVDCRGDCSLIIFDIFGREIRTIKVADSQDEVIINVESYPPGIYMAVLKQNINFLDSRKFVVAR